VRRDRVRLTLLLGCLACATKPTRSPPNRSNIAARKLLDDPATVVSLRRGGTLWDFDFVTFILLNDGRVVAKPFPGPGERGRNYRAEPYRSFVLAGEEKERVFGLLLGDDLARLQDTYGPTRTTDPTWATLRIQRGSASKTIHVYELPMWDCQFEDFQLHQVSFEHFTPLPSALVTACELIQRLERDVRAKPWP
jgi:hypothetical protein